MIHLLNAGAAAAAAAAANQTTDGSFTPDDALLLLEIIGAGLFLTAMGVAAGIGLIIMLDYFFGGPDDA